jgi:hypothetical protein
MNTKKLLTVLLIIIIAVLAIYAIRGNKEAATDGSLAGGTQLMFPTGTWTSVDDAKYVIAFNEDGRYTETYDGDMVTALGAWSMSDATNKVVITLTIDGKPATENRTWEVIKLSERELEVMHTSGRGNILRFTK